MSRTRFAWLPVRLWRLRKDGQVERTVKWLVLREVTEVLTMYGTWVAYEHLQGATT